MIPIGLLKNIIGSGTISEKLLAEECIRLQPKSKDFVPERLEGETKQDRVRRLASQIAKDLHNCLFCDYGTGWSWDKLCSVLEDMKTLANAKGGKSNDDTAN